MKRFSPAQTVIVWLTAALALGLLLMPPTRTRPIAGPETFSFEPIWSLAAVTRIDAPVLLAMVACVLAVGSWTVIGLGYRQSKAPQD